MLNVGSVNNSSYIHIMYERQEKVLRNIYGAILDHITEEDTTPKWRNYIINQIL